MNIQGKAPWMVFVRSFSRNEAGAGGQDGGPRGTIIAHAVLITKSKVEV